MPARGRKSKAVPFSTADVANIKANPYIQRLIQDAKLRSNVRTAIDSTKSAYGRFSNGKAPAKSLLEDKKLHRDVGEALGAVREVTIALTESPRKRARRGLTFGRKVLLVGIGGGVALAASEKLRSKVLDTLFGAEEEFEYTPPAGTSSSEPTETVGAA